MNTERYEPPALIWRAWAMPSPDTFSIPPIARLLDRWLRPAYVVVDPFARNSARGTLRNDLNPETTAESHEDARVFLSRLQHDGVLADAVLFDPPYSPRQISEVYQQIGRRCSTEDTQNARLYKECRDAAQPLLREGAVIVSCGWNSAGFGRERGCVQREILIVAHGGAHNDTIVTVETYDAGTGIGTTRTTQAARAVSDEAVGAARLPL